MNAKWYLARPGGAAVGPLRTDVLVHRIRAGTVSREALVWCQGMEKWLPLATVKELADAVRDDPGPPLPRQQGPRASRAGREGGTASAPERAAFEEDDADEKTELAIPGSFPEVPSSSEPTVLRPAPVAQNATLAILPGGPQKGYSESWAWQAANAPAAPGAGYEMPDTATKVVNPMPRLDRAGPLQVQKTLPAAGVPANIIPGLGNSRTVPLPPQASGPIVPVAGDPHPTRIAALNSPGGWGAAPTQQEAQTSDAAPDDGMPPPYPPGFPGPEARPAFPTAPAPAATATPGSNSEQDPVELPMAKTTAATRLAVAVVFILGLALGIFGARRVVMMRQAAQENRASDSH
jgi:hypothetical protein